MKSPEGYTFVPVGKYPDLTAKCKELSRQTGSNIYVVSVCFRFSCFYFYD